MPNTQCKSKKKEKNVENVYLNGGKRDKRQINKEERKSFLDLIYFTDLRENQVESATECLIDALVVGISIVCTEWPEESLPPAPRRGVDVNKYMQSMENGEASFAASTHTWCWRRRNIWFVWFLLWLLTVDGCVFILCDFKCSMRTSFIQTHNVWMW